MTLLQVINTIQKISSVQPNIHSFVGEFLALNDVTAKYSAIVLQQRTHRRNNDFMTYSFYLGYADRLNEDKSNEVEVQSTAIQVIDDIVYKLEDLNLDCTVGVYNTFTQRFLAEAAGGYVELDITTPIGECEDDFSKEELNATITANGVYSWIPKGLGFENVKINVDVAHLQDKSLDITKNGNYKVQYDKGFSGLKTVDVNVNVPDAEIHNQTKEELITANNKRYTYTPDKDYTGIGELNVMVQIPEQPIYEEGYVVGKEDGINEQKRKLTDINITQNGTYEKEDGYKNVVVNVPVPEIKNQTKDELITANNKKYTYTPDKDYTGIGELNVMVQIPEQPIYEEGYNKGKEDGINEQKRKLTDINITQNGTYEKEDGYKNVVVNVPVPEIKNQEKNINITENGQTDIVPDTNYTGLSRVGVNVNIDTQSYYDNGYSQGKIDGKTEGIAEQKSKLTDISITENGTYEREDGYKSVVVNVPVPEINNQEKSITINSNGTSSVVPDNGYTGISKIDITVNVPTSGGDGIDLTSLGYTAQENTSINTDIQDSIAYSQSLLKSYTDDTKYGGDHKMRFAPLFPCGNRKSFYRYFEYSDVLISIPQLDTSNGTDFSYMFVNCSALTSVPALDTSKGTDFTHMFSGCSALTSVTSLDTSNGTDFNRMFSGCNTLTSAPALDTSNGTDFSYMFYICYALTSAPALDTSKGTDFNHMFYDCHALTSVPALDTSKGTDFNHMFCFCTNLKTVESIDVSNGSNFLDMFSNYPNTNHKHGKMNLTDITFKGSINDSIGFSYCTKLSYNSIKSILTACAATTNINPKKIEFNQLIKDQNNELTNLVASCTSKGWQVTGLALQ